MSSDEAGDRVAAQKARAGEAERTENMARCAVVLRDGGQATVTQVAQAIGTSRPTAAAALEDLVARDLVVELPLRTTGGRGAGRPARLYKFNHRGGYLVGVDVGAATVKAAVADIAGTAVSSVVEDVDSTISGTERFRSVLQVVRRALAAGDVPERKVISMAMAVTGLVGHDGRIRDSRVLSAWEDQDLAGALEAEFGCAATIENDIRLATLAEQRLGAARGRADVLCLFAGRRISVGLVLDGQVRRGHHGAAGEVGDIIFSDFVDAAGTLRWRSGASAAEVFRLAAAGAADAQADVHRFVTGLSRGLATLTMGIDPDLVVIGGGISRAGEGLLAPLRAAVAAHITVPVQPQIVASELGSDAVLLGALSRAASHSSAVTGIGEPELDLAGLAEPATSDRVAGAGTSVARG